MIKIKNGHVKVRGYNNDLTLDFVALLDCFANLNNDIIAQSEVKKEIKEELFKIKFSIPNLKLISGYKVANYKEKGDSENEKTAYK